MSGAFLFFIKITLHIFVKRSVDPKFPLGAPGHLTNPAIFFLPITDDVGNRLKLVKKFANFCYLLSIILIIAFLIGINLH